MSVDKPKEMGDIFKTHDAFINHDEFLVEEICYRHFHYLIKVM